MTHSRISSEQVAEAMLGEWKRGLLTFWVLSLILIRQMYGLEIAREIEKSTQGRLRLGASTIYQLLRRLERKGLAKSSWQRSTKGPPRAYYQITRAGREVVHRFVDEVLSPNSPIALALNNLMPRVFERLNSNEKFTANKDEMKHKN